MLYSIPAGCKTHNYHIYFDTNNNTSFLTVNRREMTKDTTSKQEGIEWYYEIYDITVMEDKYANVYVLFKQS